jgi:hypothetical protein
MNNLLGPLDEELNHQTSRPFRVPATTDHRFYDRHWFELVAPGGEVAMIAGMGLFKNLGVADGFVSIQRDRLQRNIRVSRPLDDHVEAYVGPLRFEIIEPFQAIRLTLAEGDYPFACDLSWTSRFPARLEAAHLDLVDGRIVTDISRYDQSGTWTGWLRLGDDTFEADDWWGIRDHSWVCVPTSAASSRALATGSRRCCGCGPSPPPTASSAISRCVKTAGATGSSSTATCSAVTS